MYVCLFVLFCFLHTDNTNCNPSRKLGMENKDIRDDQITASSFYTRASEGRLNNNRCWVVKSLTNPWIQVNFLQQTIVTGLITQGRRDAEEWVKTLQIQYEESIDKLVYIVESGNSKVRIVLMFLKTQDVSIENSIHFISGTLSHLLHFNIYT